MPPPGLTSSSQLCFNLWYWVISRQMAPVLSCIHGWALVALAWDPLPIHFVSNHQLIPSPPGSLPGSPVSSPALALFYLLYALTSPKNIMFLVLHKFIDDNPSLDSTFCLHEGREYLGFILFPSMFAKFLFFMFFWFTLFLMNECILEENSVRSISWFWSCFNSQITVTYYKTHFPLWASTSSPGFEHL